MDRIQNPITIKAVLAGDLDPRFVRLLVRANWITLALLVFAASILSTKAMTIGILVGGVIANLNCVGLNRDCRRAFRMHNVGAYFAGMTVRMGLVTLAVLAAITFLKEMLSPIGLFVGLSVAVINFYIIVLAMVNYRVRYKEAV